MPQVAGVWHHDRGDGTHSLDDFSGIVEPTHMGVAGGELAIRLPEAWIFLDREEQFRRCFIEAAAEKMRGAH